MCCHLFVEQPIDSNIFHSTRTYFELISNFGSNFSKNQQNYNVTAINKKIILECTFLPLTLNCLHNDRKNSSIIDFSGILEENVHLIGLKYV